LTAIFESAPLGVWSNLQVPLSCWTTAGADLKEVEVPFAVATAGRFGLTIADVRLAPMHEAAAAHCP
jgi:beta-glucosidase